VASRAFAIARFVIVLAFPYTNGGTVFRHVDPDGDTKRARAAQERIEVLETYVR
jgi:hypothetical protein